MKRLIASIAIVALLAAAPARADDAPANGVPESSIAAGRSDPGRAALAGIGISYGINYIGEFFDIARGGITRGTSLNGHLDGEVDVNLEKFAGWTGATVHADVVFIHGEGPSTEHIGNIFAASNVEALESVRLFEIWVEQALLDDKLKIRAGQMAVDSEFFISDTAGHFINATFGWPGITSADMPQGGPAYPFATPGVRVQFSPNDDVAILAAVFNGYPADPNAVDPQRANRHGLNFRVDDPPLFMVEGQFKYEFGLPGMLRLGGWRHFGDFTDQRTGAPIDGDHGLYAVVDQQLWNGGWDQGVSVFGRISGSPDKQNLIDFYFDMGIVASGLVPGRAKDSFGVAFGYGDISARARAADIDAALPVIRDYEAVVEFKYEAEVMPGWTVSPDFQYIWNPGGGVENPNRPGVAVGNTAVFGVRSVIGY